jgi:hypothetical protein
VCGLFSLSCVKQDAVDKLFDVLDGDQVAALGYEEREMVTLALLTGQAAAVSPRAGDVLRRISDALDGLDSKGRQFWAQSAAELISEPEGFDPKTATHDELERELEHRRMLRRLGEQ